MSPSSFPPPGVIILKVVFACHWICEYSDSTGKIILETLFAAHLEISRIYLRRLSSHVLFAKNFGC